MELDKGKQCFVQIIVMTCLFFDNQKKYPTKKPDIYLAINNSQFMALALRFQTKL